MGIVDVLRVVEYLGGRVEDEDVKLKLKELWSLLKKKEVGEFKEVF